LTETEIAHKQHSKATVIRLWTGTQSELAKVRNNSVSLEANMSASPAVVAESSPQRLEPFVDADIAAGFLGITRRTLLQKVRAGKIPGHPLDPGAQKKEWRFKLSELDRFLGAPVHSSQQPT
jgi:excisionase family DNA binding protein